MKTLRFFLALGCLASLVRLAPAAGAAPTATFTVTFEPGTFPGDEFAVEAKQKDGTWREVAKGTASPIVFTTSEVTLGTYTIRVRSRVAADPAIVSDPSEEASCVVKPGAPGKPAIQITTITTVTTTVAVPAAP
jgi:hypothetical protein